MHDSDGHKTYKFKLKPTAEQASKLETTLLLCRELYNAALGERREAWRMRGVSLTYYEQKRELPEIKAALPEFAGVHSQVLQDVILRVERAFRGFFSKLASGESPGYPRFRGAGRYTSFTYPQMGNGARLDNGFLVLSKIGRVAVRWSRPLQGIPKTVTLIREPDGWYVCFTCAAVPLRPLPSTGIDTGIDLGLKTFLVCADGASVSNPRCFRRAERAIQKAHRRVSRRKAGSKRRAKAVAYLGKKYQKVRRQRRDHHHKTSLALLRAYDTIYFENLQVANLMRNRYLAKSINDAAWGRFCVILVRKAAYAGKRVMAVPPAFTSQDCSGCGERVPKSLSVRTHVCPSCGLLLDRDENAARNILLRGQKLDSDSGGVAASGTRGSSEASRK